MKDNESKLRKKAALDYLLAKIFDDGPSEFAQYLYKKHQERLQEDPFTVSPEVTVEPKPIKFLSSPGDQRFKALRDKVLAKEQESTESITETNAASID